MSDTNVIYACVYGSLLSSKSRLLTGISGQAFPVIVSDFERSWSCRIEGEMTALGMLPSLGRTLNAALVEIPRSELARFDDREGPDYQRTSLSWANVSPYSSHHSLPPVGDLFFYRPVNPRPPNATSMILGSYISVCLDGILSDAEYSPVSHQFAAEFLQSTRDWQFLCDDSTFPMYVRHLKSTPHKDLIARLLKENLALDVFLR